jgi:FkbM family methyltransferase
MENIRVVNYQTPYGKVYCLPHDDAFVGALKKGNLYESDILEQLTSYIKGDGDILDVGAHIGGHTLFYSQKRNPQQKIFCFEPQKVMFEICNVNINVNNIQNIETFNIAVGPYDDTIFIDNDFTLDHYPEWLKVDYTGTQGMNFGGLGVTYKEGGESVRMVALGQFLEDKTKKVHFIKMDTEGAENGIIFSIQSLIKRDKPILFVEKNTDKNRDVHFLQKCPELARFDFFTFLQSIGYTKIIPFPGQNYLFIYE